MTTQPAQSKPLRIRRLREQLTALTEYVGHLRSPIDDGYRDAPAIVPEGLRKIEDAIDELDRALLKIYRGPAAGGAVVLVEEWREEVA